MTLVADIEPSREANSVRYMVRPAGFPHGLIPTVPELKGVERVKAAQCFGWQGQLLALSRKQVLKSSCGLAHLVAVTTVL